ncbi:unnamed protein product, partial [Meganyctiphanes norvegica]
RAGWCNSFHAKMKLLWILIIAAALVAADDDDDDTKDDGVDSNTNEPILGNESIVGNETVIDTNETGGRSRSRRPNRRFSGGLGNIIGAGAALLGGVLGGGRPGRPVRPHRPHRPVQPGFGHSPHRPHRPVQPGFGHSPHRPHRPVQPGFGGGLNPGFGGGLNPGFGGGLNPGFGGPATGGCRYWCRTPQGQSYCCENSNQSTLLPFTKPGQCPPVRPSCPPTRFGGPPRTCSNDSRCPGVDKCCFDTCLQEHVCKPPLGVGK